MAGESEKIREHLDNNRVNDALTIARRYSRNNPSDLKARALLLEALYSKGEYAAVQTELNAMQRDGVDHQELQKLRARFKKRA